MANNNPTPSYKQSFESFIVEFKENRENVISILKIVIEQQKGDIFRKFLNDKRIDNQKSMKEFMKSKYYEFVESIQNINEGKIQVKATDESMNNLEETIQTFLTVFSDNYVEQLKKKNELINLKNEKEKLNIVYILFAYLNKAYTTMKEGQFELTIRLINTATEKYLKRLPIASSVYRRGESLANFLKNKITNLIEEKLTNWLVEINKEQTNIGAAFYKKLKYERERFDHVKSEFSVGGNGPGGYYEEITSRVGGVGGGIGENNKMGKSNIRVSKNIVDNLLLIRNTSNLNYMMNKNSLLKSSVLNQKDILEEFDIINMVSNVNLNFLEATYSIYKKVDNDTKFIEHFLNFRQSQIQTLIDLSLNRNDKGAAGKISNNNNTNATTTNATSNKIYDTSSQNSYDVYFSEILGFITIQIAVYELLPMFYTKRKFEDIMNYLVKELHLNLSFEFDTLNSPKDYINLQTSIFIFITAIERIGINERIGIDIKSTLFEMLKEKIKNLNFILIKRYNNYFVNLLFEEKCINIEAKNQDEYIKYASQYSITLDDNSISMIGFIYPVKLPYTMFVIEVNENFKKYVDEIFEYIKPLFTEYENIIQEVVRDFIKKINECFHTFSNFQEHDLNIILAAQICNNIRFVYKSHNFYSDYVMKKCNIKNNISFDTERAFRESSQNYEEIIYENLKKKFRHFISDLQGENWVPDKPNNKPNMYIEGMVAYISTIYMSLQTLSPIYIEFCFKEAIRFISKIYYDDFLFNAQLVKSYNIYSIENLTFDIEALNKYFNNFSLTHPGFDDSLLPIKQILMIFSNRKVDQFIDRKGIVDSFYEVKIESLCRFLMRYKNLKKSADMKGKITENDIVGLVKKLKESIAITKV